ncbi:MAG: ATP-binding protein [Anaerolineales bacterium]
MVIAVASGKGGTGKTTIAVSLARTLQQQGLGPVLVSDCDVEAPNAQIFLRADFTEEKEVTHFIPEVDLERCSGCRICSEICQFNALLVLGETPQVFPSLCHGCGSCTLRCPEKAIKEIPYRIGKLERGPVVRDLYLRQGSLQEGEPLAVPVIAALKTWDPPDDFRVEIIDSPPGASCPVVEAIRSADHLILVTEPTPFGLHDLRQAAQVARELGVPAGVIINRVGVGDVDIRGFCQEHDIPVYLEIPLDRAIGEGLARGRSLVEINPDYQEDFIVLWKQITSQERSE